MISLVGATAVLAGGTRLVAGRIFWPDLTLKIRRVFIGFCLRKKSGSTQDQLRNDSGSVCKLHQLSGVFSFGLPIWQEA
jgi:hypothetical protein